MLDPQNYIDHLLETENLTDYLEDEDADYVLNWGVTHLKAGILKIDDIAVADEFATALMGFMRALNQVTGNLPDIQPDGLPKLVERYQKAFGLGRELTQDDYLDAASSLAEKTPRQAIDYILNWLASDKNSSREGGLNLADD